MMNFTDKLCIIILHLHTHGICINNLRTNDLGIVPLLIGKERERESESFITGQKTVCFFHVVFSFLEGKYYFAWEFPRPTESYFRYRAHVTPRSSVSPTVWHRISRGRDINNHRFSLPPPRCKYGKGGYSSSLRAPRAEISGRWFRGGRAPAHRQVKTNEPKFSMRAPEKYTHANRD